MNPTISPASAVANELYEGLSPEVRQELDKCKTTVRIPRGEKLIQHGVLPGRLIILESGRVDISVPSQDNHVYVGASGPGKVFGMRAAVSGELPEINVACAEECTVGVIPTAEFLGVLRSNPQIYFSVARVLSADLKIADQLIRNCARRTTGPGRPRISRDA